MSKITANLQEEKVNVASEVQGDVPPWLKGTLIRNGPVNVSIDGKTNRHWFDGLAMLHAFTFHGGEVKYSNKFLRTEAYNTVFQKGSVNYLGFASDPCRSFFKRFFTWLVPHAPDLKNANINVAKFAEQYVALTEIPLPVKFNLQTLETLGVLDYQDHLPKEMCWESAHPHYDIKNKSVINYLIEYGRKSTYTFYQIKKDIPSRDIIAKVAVQNPSYMHSFAVTENYFILAEYPFVIKPLDLLIKGKPFIDNFSWHPEKGTQFIIIDRKSGKAKQKIKTDPFFAFHHMNAFESGSELILDIVAYEDPSIIEDIADYFKDTSKTKGKEAPSRIQRFHIAGNLATSETLCNLPLEFPRINSFFDGRPYTFCYLSDAREPLEGEERSLAKLNVQTKETLFWSEKGCSPGEPVFVAKPGAKKEDEGLLLALVLDQLKQSSFLLLLDAETFREVGRAKAPHMIPPGLHGDFFS